MLHDAGYATGFFHSGYFRLGDWATCSMVSIPPSGADDFHQQGAAGSHGVFEEYTVAALSKWVHQHKEHNFLAVYAMMFPIIPTTAPPIVGRSPMTRS